VVEVELEFVWEQFDFEVVVKKLMLSFTQPLNKMMLSYALFVERNINSDFHPKTVDSRWLSALIVFPFPSEMIKK